MRIFNYANFARVFELGISNPNMTEVAQVLFEPLISLEDVLNRKGSPYNINSKMAKDWCDQKTDIPGNLKSAAGRQDVIDTIGDYFSDHIIDVVINQLQETKMYSSLIDLIKESNLTEEVKEELCQIYEDGDRAEFLGKSFLYAVVGDNKQKDSVRIEENVDGDIAAFNELIKNHPKPSPMTPPDEVEEHEMVYVQELYRVYHEETGENYTTPDDLDGQPKYKKDFNRQRKDYYKAETIHRELRDTIRLDETEGFDILKEEMYDGIITTRDKDYDSSYARLTAVMEHATNVLLSNNLKDRMLDWVGPGEKKGVCHMLVNDYRLTWVDDEDGQ